MTRRLLLLLAAMLLYVWPGIYDVTVPVLRAAVITDLVAYYSLGEASGNALDAHSGAKTATQNGTIATTTGKVGNARDFEKGVDDTDFNFFQRTDSAFSFPTSDFTLSVWVNPESLAGNTALGAGIAVYVTGDAQGDWWLGADPNGAVVFTHFGNAGADTNGRRFTANSLLANATWAHIVARHATGTFTVWVNGTSRSLTEASTGSGYTSFNFNIGRLQTSATYRFDGLIDELAIWSAAKSDADISWLYNAGAGRSYSDIVAEGSPPATTYRNWFLKHGRLRR